MNRLPIDPNAFEIEALFAVEGEILPEPDDVRSRAMKRAREAMHRQAAVPFDARSPSPRRVTIGMAAAAVVMLSALCSVAFFAGYRTSSRRAEVPAAVGSIAPSVVSPRLAMPSVVVALVPVPTTGNPLIPSSEPVVRNPRPTPVKPTESVTSGAKSEAYALELRVLQPARQAVARHDFASALATVAEHQRLFPSGILIEEREALRVKALVGLGHIAEARRAGAAFRKQFPRSALLGRIDEMLGTPQ
jgi:hypothetical protein